MSIGYLQGNTPQFGLVFNPTIDELFTGGIDRPAVLSGEPFALHQGKELADGLMLLGCSARATVEQIVPVLDRLIRGGGIRPKRIRCPRTLRRRMRPTARLRRTPHLLRGLPARHRHPARCRSERQRLSDRRRTPQRQPHHRRSAPGIPRTGPTPESEGPKSSCADRSGVLPPGDRFDRQTLRRSTVAPRASVVVHRTAGGGLGGRGSGSGVLATCRRRRRSECTASVFARHGGTGIPATRLLSATASPGSRADHRGRA